MAAYPRPFDPALFPAIPAAVAGESKKVSANLIAHAPIEVRGALRISHAQEAAVTELWLESVADRSVRSQSFQNLDPGSNQPIAPGEHFFFLPGVDAVDIGWNVTNPAGAAKATLELFSALKPAAIWCQERAGGAAVTFLKGPGGTGRGTLGAAALDIAGDATDFPDRVPNVHGAPYRLCLTVTGSNGKVTTAWTYFDVLVHSLELHWGPKALIPAGAIQDVLPIYQPLTQRDEQALVDGLQAAATKIDPNAPKEIPLKSTNAAYKNLQEWFTWRDMSFLRFKGRWGKGPRIPLLARVALKSLAGPAGVHTAASAKALGPAEFLWDWCDKTEAIRQQELAGLDLAPRTFIMAALKYKENAVGEPPACLNAHAERGGKRGGADRIFPTFNDPNAFPWQVTAPANRAWGAFSKALTSGAYAGHAGILFQPSRLARDSYQVRVFLASGHKATLDVGGTMDALVQAHPGLPTEKTGMMEVLRQIDARYIRKGTATTRIDLAAVSSEYAKGGTKVVWTELAWGMVEFNNCATAALNPDNLAESAAYARHGLSDKEAKSRRTALNDWKVYKPGTANKIDSPVKLALGGFDQWHGRAVGGAAGGAESAANFTVPGRDLAEAPYIAAVTDDYINTKKRTVNDKLRKWNKLKAANPTVADPQLLVTFFHTVLTDGERAKLWPEVKRRYEDDGWQGWQTPRDQPEIWADNNFNFRLSKLVHLSVEMHLRKVLADNHEGVTLFHYGHFFDALNPDGSVYARQCKIGGVAAVAINTDLGLSGAFLVWDHPNNGQRQTLARALCLQSGAAPQGGDGHTGPLHGDCTFKNGNHTVTHEFGHFLHLPHASPTAESADEGAPHDSADAKCIMNYDPDALHLCGVCLLRLRGWAFFQSKGMRGFDRANPTLAGGAPPDPTVPGLEDVFDAFYTDFA